MSEFCFHKKFITKIFNFISQFFWTFYICVIFFLFFFLFSWFPFLFSCVFISSKNLFIFGVSEFSVNFFKLFPQILKIFLFNFPSQKVFLICCCFFSNNICLFQIEFIGQIELYYDRGNHYEFTSLSKELARPGEVCQHVTSYAFEFLNVEKPFESYTGSNVRLRYFLRVTIVRRISDIVKELELVVYTLSSYPEMNSSIKMEVGIEECLHIEFEYNKSKYHLKDVIVGKIYFLLVRIKIKHMEIAIIKRETTGSGPHVFTENETIAKYEIMDGAPVRGESIPIRVFLSGYDLTPTMRDINKKFSVRYYLNLVLMDEEDRRYFKQQVGFQFFRIFFKMGKLGLNTCGLRRGPQANPGHSRFQFLTWRFLGIHFFWQFFTFSLSFKFKNSRGKFRKLLKIFGNFLERSKNVKIQEKTLENSGNFWENSKTLKNRGKT